MDGFRIDLHDLNRAAETVTSVGADMTKHSLFGYSVSARSVGHADLAAALAELSSKSRQAVDALSASATEVAERMKQAAREYQGVDAIVAEKLEAVDLHNAVDSTAAEP
jgi:hypothetical protein